MGLYIEPEGNKLEWLQKNSELMHPTTYVPIEYDFSSTPKDKVVVCLVDNHIFQAAGVAFNKKEFDAFNLPGDDRPKTWFLVDREKARAIAPLWNTYMKEA